MKATFQLLLLIIAVCSCKSFSAPLTTIQLQQVAASETWRKLLHYDQTGKSTITSTKFFLSPLGAKDPEQELIATIAAFSEHSNSGDEHAQCRFPGRKRWLEQQYKLQFSAIDCPKFTEFAENNKSTSLSLVFATGFLGNPASYYGHLLLKLNTDNNRHAVTDLEATAINFGADVPKDENMVLYIIKGIIGGYDSSFSHLQYFYHSHNYGESEMRDMWEFQLELTRNELDLMVGHLWEVMGADFTYYFFDRNCAYRMGEVLELVVDSTLIEDWRVWETPQAIVQRVAATKHHGKPLVSDVHFYPSRLSRLYQRYAQLTAEQQNHVHELVAAPTRINLETISHLPQAAQHPVVDTLLDYYQVLRDEKLGDQDGNNELYRRVLSIRYLLPAGGSTSQFASENRPDQGRAPSYTNVGVSNTNTGHAALNFWLRPAYYDPLDASYGHIRHSGLSMGEIQLAVHEKSLFIRDLNIVRIDNIRSNFTGLPGDRNYSWYLEVGAKQQYLGCDDCLAFKFRSGIGYATTVLNEGFTVAAFAGMGFHDEKLLSRGTYLSTSTRANWYISEQFSMHAEAEQRWYQDHRDQQLYRLQSRWAWNEGLDSRIEYNYDGEHEIGVAMGWYW